MSKLWAIALHGGAGPVFGADYSVQEAHMKGLLDEMVTRLKVGEAALDVAEAAITELERCGLHLAGKGCGPNMAGRYELDAAIMDGRTRNAGAVAALEGFESPIQIARAVMERTPNVLLVGEGAADFANKQGMARIDDPAAYYTPVASRTVQQNMPHIGTVGATILDQYGDLAAATSTAGIGSKTWGRVGDSPLIGAGTWADERVAVSCTGLGEYFIRANAAADVSSRIRYADQSLEDAAQGALDDVKYLGGEGGLIAVDWRGNIVAPTNSGGLKRGLANSAGLYEVATFV